MSAGDEVKPGAALTSGRASPTPGRIVLVRTGHGDTLPAIVVRPRGANLDLVVFGATRETPDCTWSWADCPSLDAGGPVGWFWPPRV